MLIAALLPLLSRYSLSLDIVASNDGTVTLAIIPRLAEGQKGAASAGELQPISLTASAAEIDAELAKADQGALGQLVAARKSLADQLAAQQKAAEDAKAQAAADAKTKSAKAASKPAAAGSSVNLPSASTGPSLGTNIAPPSSIPANASAQEPASLF